MLNWFKRPKADLYHPGERTIYRYFDGQRTVAADPMVLYKKIMAVGPELSIDVKVANSASKKNLEAHDKMAAKIRSIFAVKSYAEGGLTDLECGVLLDHFWAFCESLKKNTNPTPTSPEAASPPTEPSSDAGPSTSSGSDSGSTASEPSTVGQERWRSEPGLQSGS